MNSATKEQNLPLDSDGPDVISLVRDDLEARARMGVETYGKRLQPHNGRNSLVDAYQEALDLGVYVKQRLLEEERFLRELDGLIDRARDEGASELAGLERARELYSALLGS